MLWNVKKLTDKWEQMSREEQHVNWKWTESRLHGVSRIASEHSMRLRGTECVNSSVARFARTFLWKFTRLMGSTTAAVQTGKKTIDRGSCTKTVKQTLRPSYWHTLYMFGYTAKGRCKHRLLSCKHGPTKIHKRDFFPVFWHLVTCAVSILPWSSQWCRPKTTSITQFIYKYTLIHNF